MDDIEGLKRSLGSIAGEFNEAQLGQLSRELDFAAEFLLDLYARAHSEKARRQSRPVLDGIGADRRME
jgi:hypothetical protein